MSKVITVILGIISVVALWHFDVEPGWSVVMGSLLMLSWLQK